MRRILIFTGSLLLLFSCGGNATRQQDIVLPLPEHTVPSLVTVYYFQGKQKCETCNTVKQITEKTIYSRFGTDNRVGYMVVDINDKRNRHIVDKYKIAWNALIVAKSDTSVNITLQAFSYAISNPDRISSFVSEKIESMLK